MLIGKDEKDSNADPRPLTLDCDTEMLRFEGRLHSGLDDTRNIARIALKLSSDGATLYVNEALPARCQVGGPLAAGS